MLRYQSDCLEYKLLAPTSCSFKEHAKKTPFIRNDALRYKRIKITYKVY